MPLRTYQKAMPAYAALSYYTPEIVCVEESTYPPNMWSFLSRIYHGLKLLVASSTAAGLLVPTLFIAGGSYIIYRQFQPTITEQIKSVAGYYNQGTTSPVDLDYITDRHQYVSNPGAGYFETIAKALSGDTGIGADILNYNGKMYLTIPSLGFNRLPVSANVESTSKQYYDQILNYSLAHFKGTSLPFSDTPGNTVIYGHSVGGSYNPRPDDVLAAFSFLNNLKVGDLITLEVEGIEHTYRMTKTKIINPDDISVLQATPGRENLTLITCYPPGNNSKRLVATATPVN